MNTIEQLAGVHLGKTSDGFTMQRYETPTEIDPSLLVAIPRNLNRDQYFIQNNDFVGFDRWNCYEVSTLLKNNFPVSGKVIITYNSDSPAIVESKSLKLYLNSFNMHKFNTMNVIELISSVEYQIIKDLRAIGIIPAYVEFDVDFISPRPKREDYFVKNYDDYSSLEVEVNQSLDFKNKIFQFPGESAELLQVYSNYANVKNIEPIEYKYHSSSLRSNCRVTNQPDWGDIYITYTSPNKFVTPTSLFEYIISLRTENHFHEEICEVVYKRLYDTLNPIDLLVACNYTRRGGIDINPVRASSSTYLNKMINNPRYVDIIKEKRQ